MANGVDDPEGTDPASIGDLALFVLGEDLIAEGDAFVADVDGRAGDELPDRILRLSAE